MNAAGVMWMAMAGAILGYNLAMKTELTKFIVR